MGYINEYSAVLSMAIIDFKSYYYSLEELEKMLVQPMEDIAIIKKMKMNKNDACYVIMGYFNKINGYKKSISSIKKLIVKHQLKLKSLSIWEAYSKSSIFLKISSLKKSYNVIPKPPHNKEIV